MSKRITNEIPWRCAEQKSVDELKGKLCQATKNALYIVDFNKPFVIHVDASGHSVSGILSQPDEQMTERPVAFISQKLNMIYKRPMLLFGPYSISEIGFLVRL